jgi:hypothetical protein
MDPLSFLRYLNSQGEIVRIATLADAMLMPSQRAMLRLAT